MPAGLTAAQGDIALTLTAAGAGTTKSAPVGGAGQAAYVLTMVHTTVIGGTTPTFDVTLEESTNGETGWTLVPASALPQVIAAGNAVGFAVPTKNFVRVSATVAGTTPAVTARVALLVFAE